MNLYIVYMYRYIYILFFSKQNRIKIPFENNEAEIILKKFSIIIIHSISSSYKNTILLFNNDRRVTVIID